MYVLCRLGDLAVTGAKEVVIADAGVKRRVFVVRHDRGVSAFFNACPHAQLSLNAAPDVFFDTARTVLVCANHGAHFDPATGRCVRGPSKGAALRPLPVRLEADAVVCTDNDYTPIA